MATIIKDSIAHRIINDMFSSKCYCISDDSCIWKIYRNEEFGYSAFCFDELVDFVSENCKLIHEVNYKMWETDGGHIVELTKDGKWLALR